MRTQLRSVEECDGKTLCSEDGIIITAYGSLMSINFDDNTSLVISSSTDYDGNPEIDVVSECIYPHDYSTKRLGLVTESEHEEARRVENKKQDELSQIKKEKTDKEDYERLKLQFEGPADVPTS